MPYVPMVPRSIFDREEPDDPESGWLDGEENLVCAFCAVESDNEEEVPHFRPVKEAPVEWLQPDEEYGIPAYCDQCGREFNPR